MSDTENAIEPGKPAAGDPRPVFLAMFEAVRRYLLTDGLAAEAREGVARNPKGEATRGFDASAERIALDVARRDLGSFRVFSEEVGEVISGHDRPAWTLVLDPCDGSNNYRRGIRSVGFAIAALPPDAPLDPDAVEYAVCGDIFTGSVYSAARGRGATLAGRSLASSLVTDPLHAVLGVNLGRERSSTLRTADDGGEASGAVTHQEGLWRLLRTTSTIRRSGASVLDLCYVAEGAYDAYVDLRGRLTPENFLAPALILREAGGLLTNAHGAPLGPVAFTTPYSVLAAGSRPLLDALLAILT
jgi:myo-inositol-1(or 4)-monophosphatase